MYEQFINRDTTAKQTTASPVPSHNRRLGSRKKNIALLSVILSTVLVGIIAILAFTGVIPLFNDSPVSAPTTSGSNPFVSFPPDFVVALKEFYVATNGDNWYHNKNWLREDMSICQWYGIECKEVEHWINGTAVNLTEISISMEDNNLNGTLPGSLSKITWLGKLELSNNLLNGSIPKEFVMFPQLKVLKLSANNLKGTLPNAGLYPTLQEIDLSKNQFYGTIPENFFTGELNNVYLNNNQLEGTIPDCQSFIVALDLSSNRLSGNLPFFGVNIVSLDLSNNYLSGDSHSAVTSSSLKYLNLANNQFVGHFSIPNYQLTKVVKVNISHNYFESWRDVYGRLPDSLVWCDARNNSFLCPFGSSWIENICHAECK